MRVPRSIFRNLIWYEMIFIPYQGVKRKMQAFRYPSTYCSLHNVLQRTKMLWKIFLNLEKQYHFVLLMGETQALTHLFHSCTQTRSLLSRLRQLSRLDKQTFNHATERYLCN